MTPEQIPVEARDEAEQFKAWLFSHGTPLSDYEESELAYRFDMHGKQQARDILAENARLREALEAIIQRAKTADEFREKHSIAHMGMISMSDQLLIKAQAALAARGK